MPYLLIQTNRDLSREQQMNLATQGSRLVSRELGKPESYVMVAVEAGKSMTFAGSVDDCAYLELKSLGLPEEKSQQLSASLCEFIEQQIQVPPSRVYIELSNPPRHLWGWNRSTF